MKFGYQATEAGWNFKRACNLKLVFQIIQKMTEKYCPWFYVSINQVWLVKELWFK